MAAVDQLKDEANELGIPLRPSFQLKAEETSSLNDIFRRRAATEVREVLMFCAVRRCEMTIVHAHGA